MLDQLEAGSRSKRDLELSDGESPVKEKKVAPSVDIKQAFEDESLNKLTVQVLSAFLRENGMSTSGMRKQQLVGLVKEYFTSS